MAITCGRDFDGGEKLVFGTDAGVYLTNRRGHNAYEAPTRKLDLLLVTQLEVFERQQLLLALADGCLYAFPLAGLLMGQALSSPLKRGKRVCFCNSVDVGALGTKLSICCVKSSPAESSVKIFELPEDHVNTQEEAVWNGILSGERNVLQLRKQVSAPARVDRVFFTGHEQVYLATNMGVQTMVPHTSETKPLLDDSDAGIDLGDRDTKDTICIEPSVDGLLLSCFDISIYIDHSGRRACRDWKIEWREPFTDIATLMNKIIVAFNRTGLEAQDISTGTVVYSTEFKAATVLQRRTNEILFSHEDEEGRPVIALLYLHDHPDPLGPVQNGLDITEILRFEPEV